MITVTVLHFAALREARGLDSEQVSVPNGTSCGELFAQLFPGPLKDLPVGVARNQSYTKASAVLEDGDEVAFLPPLGGG